MNQNNGKRKTINTASTYGMSKPSKQSLVARGLATNEDQAGKRLQEQYQVTQRPGYIFYNSSDSDADQVYSMNKRLNRCSSLLKKVSKENDKPAVAKVSNVKQKKEVKKVVKIVLPSAMKKSTTHDPSVNSAAKSTRMVTSTPNVKTKTTKSTTKQNKTAKKTSEEELLHELAKVEMEKNILQEQYSQLLQQQKHLKTIGNQTGSSSEDRHENYQAKYTTGSRVEPIGYATAWPKTAQPRSESYEVKDTSSTHTQSSVFEELERTITGISEKLSFPRSRTPSQSTLRTTDVDSTEPIALSHRTKDITTRNEAENHNYLSRNSSSTPGDISGEFFPLLPSADAAVTHVPRYCLYSSDSLEEASNCPSSLSESDCDKTVIASSVMSLNSNSVDSQDFSPRGNTEGPVNKQSEVESVNQSLEHKRTNTAAKTVRFMQAPSPGRSGNVSSSDEVNDIASKLAHDDEASRGVNEADLTDADAVKLAVQEKSFPVPEKEGEGAYKAVQPVPRSGERKGGEMETHGKASRGRKSKGTPVKTVNLKSDKRENKSEIENEKRQYFESPTRFDHKSSMDVVSQVSHINKGDRSHQTELPKVDTYAGGVKPGFAATQITALSYLFKELMKLLSNRINSEEDRLLTEIDHMIGMLPFLINNLNPDLQTEVSLAVQPLRVENSGLRRQLRIANQKIRDFESKIENLSQVLKEAEKRAVDDSKLEKLRMQLNQDEAERRSLKGKIDEINKTLEELRTENQRLIQQISEKDHEVLKHKQLWQKEKTSIYAENGVMNKKLESLSLALQAQEKQKRIVQLSLSQSEAEVIRVKELNRDLRDSVAKLLRDVNYKEPKIPDMQRQSTFDKQLHKSTFNSPNYLGSLVEKNDRNLNQKSYPITLKPSSIKYPVATHRSNGKYDEYCEYSEIAAERTAFRDANKAESDSFASSSDQNCDVFSISSVSDLATRTENTSAGRTLFVDDQFSILTCDSGEFTSNLADLSSKIRHMQESLHNAKRT